VIAAAVVDKQTLRWFGLALVFNMGVFGWEACGSGDSTAGDAGPDVTVADTNQPDAFAGDGSADSSPPDATGDGALDASADVDPYADADPNCADYTDAAPTAVASVNIMNDRDAAVYLGFTQPSCDFYLGFDLADQNQVQQRPSLKTCESTCAELQSACPCSGPCQPPIVTKLAPGKSYSIGWPGTVFVDRPMPPKCYADAGCNKGTCPQEVAAPSGTVSTTAYTAYACGDAGSCFDCTTGAGGSCIVTGAVAAAGTALPASAAYTYGQSLVVLHVQ
jgi:hypothetical protein